MEKQEHTPILIPAKLETAAHHQLRGKPQQSEITFHYLTGEGFEGMTKKNTFFPLFSLLLFGYMLKYLYICQQANINRQ